MIIATIALLISIIDPISNPENPTADDCRIWNNGVSCGYVCVDENGGLLSAGNCVAVNGQNSAEGYTCTDCSYGPAGNECTVSHNDSSMCPY